MTELFHALLSSLADPFRALVTPGQRVFLPFLLSSVAFGAIVLAAGGRLGALRDLLDRRVWAHRSARLDYRLLFAKAAVRAVLGPLLLGARVVSVIGVAAAVAYAIRSSLGDAPSVTLSAIAVGALLTLAAFVVEDFVRFALHRAMHRVPALWEIHKLHHSAEVLTPFTLYRTHPVESAINGIGGVLAIGAVTGAFVWAFGGRVRGWEVLGVDALGFAWTLCGANLRHSHVWLSYGPRVERFLLSPAQHQVHHSIEPRHHDTNFGTALAMWDRVFGSLYVTREREALRFGLPDGPDAVGGGVGAALLLPLGRAVCALVEPLRPVARRLREPLRVSPARVLLAACALVGTSCAQEVKKLDRAALLRAFGECTIASYRDFATAATALETAVDAAAQGAPDPARRAQAQAAWRAAIDIWQQAEVTQYGPAGTAPSPGAMSLREDIYAWPNVNRCLIEEQLVGRGYESAIAAAPSSARGLGALEYLLFYEGADNACVPTALINSTGAWAALGATEIATRKAAYARAAVKDLATRAKQLAAAWEPSGGNFIAQLATAGSGSTVYATQGMAFDAVGEGLFYVETYVKDLKLAKPLGLSDCATGSCPEAAESTWAGQGRSHLANNLVGFGRLLSGCGGADSLGFDDLLVDAGAGAVAERMVADVAAARAAVDAIPQPGLAEAIAASPAQVRAAHDAVKELTDALKGEFSLILQITAPGRIAGDTD